MHHSELFFRTSRATRVTPRFLGETRILPPLVYAACTETLLKLSSQFRGVDVYFADREADPFIVELAGRLGAYVTAIDSDYVILNTPGYLGYIPLDELAWKLDVAPEPVRTRTISIASSVASFSISDFGSDGSILDDLAEFDDSGFVPVKKKRVRKISAKTILHPPGQAPVLRSLIPPEEYSSLTFPVYTPETVATSLGIPAALLPLLAAIVGNDFTKNVKPISSGVSAQPGYTHHKLLFEHKLNSTQRIVFAANTLSSVLKGGDKKKKHVKPKQRSVLELIRSTVTQMLVHPGSTTERQIDDIVNGIVESALQYAIPPPPLVHKGKPQLWPTPFCALHHDIEQCRLEPFVPVPPEEDDLPQHSPTHFTNPMPQHQDALSMVQNLYLRQYREGSLDPKVLDILVTATMWPRLFLENPDHPSASGPLDAGGSLRQWVYAIVDQGIGAYIPPPSEEDDEDSSEDGAEFTNGSRQVDPADSDEEDDDEVIDVIEDDDVDEDEDPLVALKGALQRLKGVSSSGMSGGLPTIPDQGDESDEDSVEDGATEECYVTEYVRRGHRVAETSVLIQDLNALLEKAVERDNGEATSQNFGRPTMHNHTVDRTSRSHPIQLAEEKQRLCVLLVACGSDTQRVRKLDRHWVGPVIITRWLVRWAGMVEKEKGGSLANPLLKTWSKGEIAALLRAFHQEDASTPEEPPISPVSPVGPLEMSDRAVQLMARTLSVVEATRMLIQVLCLTSRVPLSLSKFRGRVFHEGCEGSTTGTTTVVDATVVAAVEEGLEEYIREDWVKKPKKKKESKPAPVVRPMQKGMSFNLLAQLDATA